ncbi:hypothetical protein E2P65_00815, partial [Candidatus Bathyarchaeota archaeon]
MKPGSLKIIDGVPLLSMVAITVLSFTGVAAQGFTKFIYMAVVTLAPGYYLVKIVGRRYPLHVDEFITTCMVASGLSLLFSYVILSTLFVQVEAPLLWLALTSVALVSCVGYYLTGGSEQGASLSEVYPLLGLLVCYLPSIVIIARALPQEYWRGSDAWETHSVVRSLVSNTMSPPELVSYWRSFVFLHNFGYYYLLAAFSLATGFSVDAILRFGGIFQAAFLAFLTYIAVKKMLGTVQGVVASWLLFLNPWLVQRFVTPIRENFSIFLLIFIVYYIQLAKSSKTCSRTLNVLMYAIILSASIMIHALTPIFILGIYFAEAFSQYLGGSHEKALDYIISTMLAVLFLGVFYPFIFDPFTSFLNNNPGALLLIPSVPLAALCMFLLKKRGAYGLFGEYRFRAAVIALIELFFVLSVLNPPRLGSGFDYKYVQLDFFSLPLLLLSLVGFFTFVKREAPASIVALSLTLSASMAVSYAGVEVPLERLAIYMMFVMCYAVTRFFSAMYTGFDWGDVSRLTWKGLFNNCLEWGKINRALLVILLVFSAVSVNDVRSQRRFYPTYTSYEVEAARSFVSGLEDGDIIYTQGEAEILLYYLGVPRNNIVHDPVKEQTLKAMFSETSPFNVSDLVHENYPNATRLRVVLQDYESFSVSTEPITKIFQYYTSNRQYGSTYVYSLSVPFTVEAIEPQTVKFIERLGGEPVIAEGGSGEWDNSITSFSNCLFEKGQSHPFKMYYAGEDTQGSSSLGLAYSANGIDWVKHDEPLYSGEYRYLYLLKDGGLYCLFCQRVSDFSIVRLESTDGVSWGNEMTVFESSPADDVRVQEAPVVWIEDQKWYMLFWELKVGQDQFYSKMI